MIDERLHPALREAIRLNEIGDASPYALSYARYGASGASFGVFQADTHTDAAARETLQAVLATAKIAAGTAERILLAVSRACPHGDPLCRADAQAAEAALRSTGGRAAVDALDERLFHQLLAHLEACVAAAGVHGRPVAPAALLYMALWINMSGPPNALCAWLRAPPAKETPAPHPVTAPALEAYLGRTAYFARHPESLAHLRTSVRAAALRLPAAA